MPTELKARFDAVAAEITLADGYRDRSGREFRRVTETIRTNLGYDWPEQDEAAMRRIREGMRKGSALDHDVECLVNGWDVYVWENNGQTGAEPADELARRADELRGFVVFWTSNHGFGLQLLGTQVRVCDTIHDVAGGLAGTMDLVARVVDADVAQRTLPGFPDAAVGDVVILDVKRTGASDLAQPYFRSQPSATVPGVLCDSAHTYRLQLTAYRRLFEATYGLPVKPHALFLVGYHHHHGLWRMTQTPAWDDALDRVLDHSSPWSPEQK